MTEAKASATPLQLGVRCDRKGCGTYFEADFLVRDDATRDERLQVVLDHVAAKEGWQVFQPDGVTASFAVTLCPAHKTDCPECQDTGLTWPEEDRCTCGTGPSGYYGMHERYCGAEPCPRGCPVVPPTAKTED